MTEPLELRTAHVTDVSFPKRLVELIVMPYETATAVDYKGRTINEIVSRGAFNGVQTRTRRINVNRDHDYTRTIGKTLALHPSRHEGLVAEVKISRTELGEETLVLADDGILDASAGFRLLMDEATGRAKRNAEVWETRTRRRLNHLHLDHIALTPDPAYRDAKVLSVRTAQPEPEPAGTPNLDRLQVERFRALYADIDRRYGLGSQEASSAARD